MQRPSFGRARYNGSLAPPPLLIVVSATSGAERGCVRATTAGIA